MSCRLLLTLSMVCLAATPALAQRSASHLQVGFGSETQSGMVTGEVDAAIYGQTSEGPCAGFIAALPSRRFVLTADFPELTVAVDGYGSPTSLVVYGPNGRRCSGLPVVGAELGGPWPAGAYTVYVGAHTQYGWVAYDLIVTETAADRERVTQERASAQAGLDGSLGDAPNLGAEVWEEDGGLGALLGEWPEGEAGFGWGGLGTRGVEAAPPVAVDAGIAAAERPVTRETVLIDPGAITALVFDGLVSQEVAVADLEPGRSGAWEGRVGINPDFAVQVTGATDNLLLELDSPSGPTLVRFGPVGMPGASWTCGTASGGPARLGGRWEAGRYLVWLGTTGGHGAYRFTVASAP
jgi:hypothetical protein